MTLEEEFQQDVLNGVQAVKREHGYNPTYFLRVVATEGALQAAKTLLAAPNAQAGLHELCLLDRLNMSMEATVLESKYRTLFTDAERDIAKKRLKELGYSVTPRRAKATHA